MKKIIFFLILLATQNPAYAMPENIPDECKQYFAEETETPVVLINEVSFKNSPDWIEFFVSDDKNNGLGTDLKNFEIHGDSEIKKLPKIILKTGDYFTLTFNSETQDSPFSLFAKNSGLTGTTEQITIESDTGDILDMICWTNESPVESEKEDFLELQKQNQWVEKDIQSCIKSTEIKDKESIGRTHQIDSNTKYDWQIFTHPTKGQKNEIVNNPPTAKIKIQSGEPAQKKEVKINLSAEDSYDADDDEITFLWDFGDNETSITENPNTHTYNKVGAYIVTLEVKDSFGATSKDSLQIQVLDTEPKEDTPAEDTPDKTAEETPDEETPAENEPKIYPQIFINELLPDPEGTDSGNEWIEIKNPNTDEVNLTSWTLDDGEDGSKPFVVKNMTISGGEYLVIQSDTSKINLNNDEDKVRLFDPDGILKDEVFYEKAKSGYSLARKNETEWYWTETPTKGEPNMEIIETEQENPDETNAEEKPQEEEKIYQDGDISDELEITEILPNPEGTDSGNEWIEIKNGSDENINMGNWQIDDGEKGSKPYLFPDVVAIKQNGYLVVMSKESKLNLGNKKDTVRLFAPDKELVDSAEYENAPSGMSYSKIKLIQKNRLMASITPLPNTKEQWEWTNKITKGEANPVYETFTAEITEEPDLSTNTFEAKIDDKILTISLGADAVDPKIAKSTLIKGSTVEINAKRISDTSYELKNYQIKDTPKKDEKQTEPLVKTVATILLLLGILVTLVYIYKDYKRHAEIKAIERNENPTYN